MNGNTSQNRNCSCFAIAICLVTVFGSPVSQLYAQTPSPTPVHKNVKTSIGTTYCLDEDFLPTLEGKIVKIRAAVRAQRAKGKFIGYISMPIAPTGGGSADINKRVGDRVKKYLENEYGNRVWLLLPVADENAIPVVNGKNPHGEEYNYVWTQVLGGEDGHGRDFDLFYFVGPSDFWRSLNLTPKTAFAVLDQLADEARLPEDAKRLFVSYYAFRASATASKGSHDEWNVLRLINDARRSDTDFGVGDQIASFFDGRPVELDDVETSVSSGYEGTCK
jgi:hypothetical protein